MKTIPMPITPSFMETNLSIVGVSNHSYTKILTAAKEVVVTTPISLMER